MFSQFNGVFEILRGFVFCWSGNLRIQVLESVKGLLPLKGRKIETIFRIVSCFVSY